jgi:hypothetical protein
VKLPAHRAGLPGEEVSFILCPLTPAYKAGLAGRVPVNLFNRLFSFFVKSNLRSCHEPI